MLTSLRSRRADLLTATADPEQQVEDKVARGCGERDDVDVVRVHFYSAGGRHRVEEYLRRRLQQYREAVDGVGQLVGVWFHVGVDHARVDEDEHYDQGKYRADERQSSSSFSPRRRETSRRSPKVPVQSSSSFSVPSILTPGRYGEDSEVAFISCVVFSELRRD